MTDGNYSLEDDKYTISVVVHEQWLKWFTIMIVISTIINIDIIYANSTLFVV
jgi:hypothetical protein